MDDITMMSYAEARPLLKTGDILLAVGAKTNIIAAGTRAVTHSEYTHAAVCRVDYGRLIAYEAVAEGTMDNPLGEWSKHHYQKVSVFRSDAVNIADMLGYLLDNKGKKYDVAQIGKIWWHELFNTKLPDLNSDALDMYVCSAYDSGALVAGGVDPCLSKPNAWTYPSDLAVSPALTHILDFTI